MQPQQTNIAYLLGSGISIYAGMSSTSEITKRVLSGDGVHRDSDEVYRIPNSRTGVVDDHVWRIVGFLRQLKSISDIYYLDEPERLTNYEDLYYLAYTISDSEMMKDNPLLLTLIQALIPSIIPSLTDGKLRKWQLSELAKEAMNYIRDIVWALLNKQDVSVDYLENLMLPCFDQSQNQVYVFTLNHDILIEKFFSEKRIDYISGFKKKNDCIRDMDLALFNAVGSEVRLLKLHGSINWFRYDAKNILGYNYGIPKDNDIWHQVDENNRMRNPLDGRPELLIGTINKFYDYTMALYSDLHRLFLKYLEEARHLVICGYGFGDRVINRYIVQWHAISNEHKITIVHHGPSGLKGRMRGSIVNILNGRTEFIPKKVEAVAKEEIKKVISK